MNLPTLAETVQLITACIRSSETQPQLSTCREMIDSFITQRYKHYESAMDITMALDNLDKEIEDRKVYIGYMEGGKVVYGLTA